jgi:hypothetical protein
MTDTASDPNQMLSTQEAARLLGLQPCTLSAWREDGSQPGLAFFKLGKAVRYRYGDILSFIATRKASSTLTARQMAPPPGPPAPRTSSRPPRTLSPNTPVAAPATLRQDTRGRIAGQTRTRKKTKQGDDRQPSLF